MMAAVRSMIEQDWCSFAAAGGWAIIAFQILLLGIFGYYAAKHLAAVRHEPGLYHDVKRWAGSSLLGALVILACLTISPAVLGDDPLMLWRYIILRTTAFAFGVIALVGGLLFVDSVTPGDWLEKVENTAYGPVILLSVVTIAIAIIIAYV